MSPAEEAFDSDSSQPPSEIDWDDQPRIRHQAHIESDDDVDAPLPTIALDFDDGSVVADNDNTVGFEDGESSDDSLYTFAQHILSPKFCPPEAHIQSLEEHIDEFTNRDQIHHKVWEVYEDTRGRLPNVLSQPEMLTLAEANKLSITDAQFETMFSGIDPEGGVKNICLHRSEGPKAELRFSIQWDLDSVVGFADSLAAFKHPIKFVLVSANASKIASNLHFAHDAYIKRSRTLEDLDLEEDTSDLNQHTPIQVRNCHHRYFGKIHHVSEIEIYFVWPEYPIEPQKSPHLTDEEARLWTDHVLEPAIRSNDHQADNAARPARYDDAVRDSAAQTEHMVGGT